MQLHRRRMDDGLALYESDDGSCSYIARAPATNPPEEVDTVGAWAMPGAFVFGDVVSVSLPELAKQVGVGPDDTGRRTVAWLSRVRAPVVMPVHHVDMDSGRVSRATTITLGNVDLVVTAGTTILVGNDTLELPALHAMLHREGCPIDDIGLHGATTMTLGGAAAGVLTTRASWNCFRLFTLFEDDPDRPRQRAHGGQIRYFVPHLGGHDHLVYPFLAAVDDTSVLEFDVAIDPASPFDGGRTRLMIATGSDASFLSGHPLVTTAGAPVGVVPRTGAIEDRAGFYLGVRPALTGEAGPASVYLAPMGRFTLHIVDDRAARLMCGLNSLESCAVHDGDVLELVPGRPARVSPAPASTLDLLDAEFTTSWFTLPSDGPDDDRAYFSQPEASVNYAVGAVAGTATAGSRVATGGMTLPGAVAARAGTAAGGCVPIAPYGSLAGSAASLDVRAVTALERDVLTVVRGSILAGRDRTTTRRLVGQPTPPPDPVFYDALGHPLAADRTSTQQGFVVTLNRGGPDAPAAGTWRQVDLAFTGDTTLHFGPTPAGTVDPWLASALLRDQLFLVLADWTAFPMAQWRLQVAGFDVDLAPRDDDLGRRPVLVMKFQTQRSLRECLTETALWTEPDVFVGDFDAAAALKRAMDQADATAGTLDDPFRQFRETADRADWTGLIIFDCPIDGNGMPTDLQMILSGIPDRLRAHHVGVALNRLTVTDTGGPRIAQSSVFGVIHVQPTAVADPQPVTGAEFVIEQLDVVFDNSHVQEFHCRAAVALPSLFGRPVTLIEPAGAGNTVRLIGRYQQQEGVGAVTFETPHASVFAFDVQPRATRVLDRLHVTGASLAPRTPTDEGSALGVGAGESMIRSRLELQGALSFHEDPFPDLIGLDLFSYGAPGLPIAGIAFDVECRLDADGSRLAPPTLTENLRQVTVTERTEARRSGSLVSNLPVTVDGFLHDPDGLTAIVLGAATLNVPELQPAPHDDPDRPEPPPSYATSAPLFALRFALPLGSLGALADSHASLDASLVIGWGPSTFTPDDDAAGVFVQLPALSAGAFGFDIEGLLETTFGDANLVRVKASEFATYVILFNNVAISLFGLRFPPRVVTDLIVFSGPDASSVGWSLAATQPSARRRELAATPAEGERR